MKHVDGVPVLSNATMILTGSILLLCAGALLSLLSHIHMPIDAARIVGWSCAAIATVGALMQATTSFLFFGDGMASVVGSWMGGENTKIWMISPVITSVFSLAAFYMIFTFIPRVTSLDGRATSENLARHAMMVAGALALGLFVPWSMATVSGVDGVYFNSAGQHFADDNVAMGMHSFLQLFIAAAWIGILSVLLIQFAVIVQDHAISLYTNTMWHILNIANGALFAAVAVYYLLTLTWLFHPGWGDEIYDGMSYMPGWFNFALIPLLVFWGLSAVRDGLASIEGMKAAMPPVVGDAFGA